MGPDGATIEVKESLKDLGVHLRSDLSFKVQVNSSFKVGSMGTSPPQEEKLIHNEINLEDSCPT